MFTRAHERLSWIWILRMGTLFILFNRHLKKIRGKKTVCFHSKVWNSELQCHGSVKVKSNSLKGGFGPWSQYPSGEVSWDWGGLENGKTITKVVRAHITQNKRNWLKMGRTEYRHFPKDKRQVAYRYIEYALPPSLLIRNANQNLQWDVTSHLPE